MPPVAQEDEGRSGNTTDHNVDDGACTGYSDNAMNGIQATGAPDNGNNDGPLI